MSGAKEVKVNINGNEIWTFDNRTILEAAKENKIDIPHLCYDSRLDAAGACRMCLVEVKGQKKLQTACTTQIAEGMKIITDNKRLYRLRKTILELILSDHPNECMTCEKDGACELQRYAYEYGVKDVRFKGAKHKNPKLHDNNKLINRDYDKCILCGRCERMCNDFVQAKAIDFVGRGFDTMVSTAYGDSLLDTTCELCGQCISACPTGALTEKQSIGQGRAADLKKVRSVCTYCGVGCNVELNIKNEQIVKITADKNQLPNYGNLCVKGRFGYNFVNSPERLKTPLIKKDGKFIKTSWDNAYKTIAKNLLKIRNKYGGDSIGFISSCRCTNEENYLVQKMARAVFKTNNVDQCARTCHAPTVAGLALSFGSGAMTNSIGEIQNCETLFIIGSNTTEAHPVIAYEMKKAKRKGAKIIVCDPRKIWMTKISDIHLQQKPGTDIPLINAMMNVIITEGLEDKEYIKNRTEGFDVLKETVMKYTPEMASKICEVPAKDIRKAAIMYATGGSKTAIFYTLGITEHICGTDNVRSLANLAMLCGNVGKESAGVNPLRGQNNVQGGCDMGALPNGYHGYQKLDDPQVKAKFEKKWNVKGLSTKTGYTITEMLEKAREGKLKAIYIMAEDIVMSEPASNHVKNALKKMDFVVLQDIFMVPTAKYADVILPGTTFAEKDGTFTNTERRIQRIRKAIEPLFNSKPDWQIIVEVMRACGYDEKLTTPSDIWDELAELSDKYSGISYRRIDKDGIQWPCPTYDHPGTKYLHKGKFTRGLGKFFAIEHRDPDEMTDEQYPLLLSTGRILYHYNVGSMTRKTPGIHQKVPENFVQINPKDAANLKIENGNMVKIQSRRGMIKAKAVITDQVKKGRVWMPFHFAESMTNIITNPAYDNISKTGEYKVCAVNISCNQL